jgi:hypothetical protein
MSAFTVSAYYEPNMDNRREKRINAALDRCGVRRAAYIGDGDEGSGPFPIYFSDIDWEACEDNTETMLEISVDDKARALRLASELRACGMVVSVCPFSYEE